MSTTAEPTTLRWTGDDGVHRGVRRRGFTVARPARSVPGLLWTPPGPTGAARGLVLVGHGGSGHKGQDYVRTLARRMVLEHGMAAAAIDGPVHGDRRKEPGAPPALVLLEFAQLWADDGQAMTDAMVADWRATLDALEALPELAGAPVGWWGLSLGTIIGLPLVAAEERVRAAVLGLMGLTGPTRQRLAADAVAVRCPVHFLVQWDDSMFPRQDTLALFDALASADKSLHGHPGDHGAVPSQAHEASADFLAAHLAAAGRTGA